jgi:hypothetical protein
MRPQLALLALLVFVAQSGCTLLYGDRQAGSGGIGSGGSGGSGGGGSNVGGGGSGGGSGHPCVPSRCSDTGADCGTISDGCDGTLACGDCASGQTCGGAGPNRCGSSACVPQTCQQLGVSCGRVSDGCAGIVDCGTCPTGSWYSIGTLPYNFDAVAYGASGLWIADETGNVVHSTDDTNFATQKVQSGLSTLYLDGAEVWAGGADGISHKSASATSFTIVVGSPGYVQSIHGVPGSLYAVTDDGASGIYHSTDGATWSAITPSPAPMHLRAVFARSASDVFAAGDGGMIYHSTDTGATWTKGSVGNIVLFSAWASGSLVVVGSQGRFFRSTDAGASWTPSVYGSSGYLGLSGTGANDVWAVGDRTVVLHSTDGAATWTPSLDVAGGVALYGIYADAAKQYAVGDSGAIIARTN